MSDDKTDISQYGVPYEDLNASDIDDEDGDMVLEQHVTVNNTVSLTFTMYQLSNLKTRRH